MPLIAEDSQPPPPYTETDILNKLLQNNQGRILEKFNLMALMTP